MRHVQLTVATVALGPRDLPLRHGTLQVVERDAGPLDWELVLHTIEFEPVANAVHPLTIVAITGADDHGRLITSDVEGEALLVRGVEHSVVFRGHSDRRGFDRGLLV